MAEISATGLEKDRFRHYLVQMVGFRNALDFPVGVLTICRMPEVSAGAVAQSSKEMARSAIFLTGRGRGPSCQLQELRHPYKKAVAKEVEMDRVLGKHHHRGERADRKKGLGPQDVSSRRNQSSNEHLRLQNSITSGEPRCDPTHQQ